MVSIKKARLYCNDDFSLIENYDKAKSDLFEVWDIHHRKEEEGYSCKELIDLGLYYNRPASELIFLTHTEHSRIHHKGNKNCLGKHHSEETRKKISKANKGNKYFLGKHHSEETKRKISEAKKGEKCYWYGKTGEKSHRSKPILQIDKQTGDIIKTWPCAMEVQRVLGIGHGNISRCCSGKYKSAGGFVWRYVD